MKLKIKKIILCCCLYFLAFSAAQAQEVNDFFFEEAQPRKEDALAHFPRSFRGLYKSDKDSTKRLRITADSILFEIPMVQYSTVAGLQAKNYTLRDSVVVTAKGKELPCLVKNDTVFFIDFAQSVFFARAQGQVIKMIDRQIIISKQIAENKWECTLLYEENGKMCLAYFDFSKKDEEIRNNKRIDEVKEIPPYFIANLRKKDFLKLVDKNYFPVKNYFNKRFDWQ